MLRSFAFVSSGPWRWVCLIGALLVPCLPALPATAQATLRRRTYNPIVSPQTPLRYVRLARGGFDGPAPNDFAILGSERDSPGARLDFYYFDRLLTRVSDRGDTMFIAEYRTRINPVGGLWGGDILAHDLDGNGTSDIAMIGVADTAVNAAPDARAILITPSSFSVTSLPGLPKLANGRLAGHGELLAATGKAPSGQTRLSILRRTPGQGAHHTLVGEWPGLQLGAMDFGDCDGDGDADLALTGVDRDDALATLLARNDGGVFTVTRVESALGLVQGDLKLRDLDGDGDADLVLTGNTYGPMGREGRTQVFEAQDCSFDREITPSEVRFQYGTAIEVGDLQHDGTRDLLLSLRVGVYLGEVWEFAFPITPTSTARRREMGYLDAAMAMGDVNQDGIDDLLIAGDITGPTILPNGSYTLIPRLHIFMHALYFQEDTDVPFLPRR